MPQVDVVVESEVSRSMRCRQVEALFDVPRQERQSLRWSGEVPLDDRKWNVGLIVGPSGCGKSTLAANLFKDALAAAPTWGAPSVLDDFPQTMKLEEIASICQAVGFNTIPAWLRPYEVLSNGEKFRVMLARLLAELPDLAVLDEFTSVVDRQVAKIGSHAVQKYVRKRDTQFVAVSCHNDIIEWLNPDWILEPATMTFTWRSLQRRPAIDVAISRVDYSAWRVFAPYHYMTAHLHKSAACYVLSVAGEPAVFAGILFRPHAVVKDIWGISRVVTLPDYQGLGLAFVLTETIGAALKTLGKRLHNYPAHPAYVRACDRSPQWRLEKKPGLIAKCGGGGGGVSAGSLGGRPNAVFSYAGEPMADATAARQLLAIPSLSRQT